MKRATIVQIADELKKLISIHALVKRATAVVIYLPDFISISIHALVKRATFKTMSYHAPMSISIHALVKRATTDRQTAKIICNFNPRPREEGDEVARFFKSPWFEFQSTPS